MNSHWRQIACCFTALLLIAAMIAGCVTHTKPPGDSDWAMGRPEDPRQSVSGSIGNAAATYYECCGKWPASMPQLRSLNCNDAAKRAQISNYLAQVPWNAVSNVVFKTVPDGRLAVSLTFASRTISTNGNSITFGGEKITEMLDVPKNSKQ